MTRTRAMVLRAVKYGESGLVVDMLTEKEGRVSFMVKLSKSPKCRFRKQLFMPLTIVEVDFDYRMKSNLQRLLDIRMAQPLPLLAMDPYKLSIGMFLSEFLVYATRDENDNAPLYNYVENSLLWLDGVENSFTNIKIRDQGFMNLMVRYILPGNVLILLILLSG